MSEPLTQNSKLLLLAALLTNDRIISNNGKSFLKEMILRRDSRIIQLLQSFEGRGTADSSFLESLHELIMLESQTLYNELFFDTSLEVGKTLSKKERDSKDLTQEKSLIYGEVEYNSFYRVLRKINPAPGLAFYDLGSGTGKAVFAARFTYDFAKCIGIEILSSLHAQAAKVVDRFNSNFKDHLALGQSQHAMVYEGSFLDFDWSDGDVVFANSTCFDDSLMLSLSKEAEKLKPGAVVVTFTKGMTNAPRTFELLERKRYRMSWGPATVFIHRRLRADGSPVGPPALNVLPSDNITYDDEVASSGAAAGTADESDDGASSRSDEEGDEDEEGADSEDRDYDDDIDMYIKQGFDMDPDEEAQGDDGSDYDSDEEGEDGEDGGEGADGDEDASEGSSGQDEDRDEDEGEGEGEGSDQDEGKQAEGGGEENQRSPVHAAPAGHSTASPFSPPRSAEKRVAAQFPAGAGTSPHKGSPAPAGNLPSHRTPEKEKGPNASTAAGQTGRNGATITIEAPPSAGRPGKLTMLSPALMNSPASGQRGADSPSVQIHSPLDNALLMRKRAAAVNRRVPMSAYPNEEDDA